MSKATRLRLRPADWAFYSSIACLVAAAVLRARRLWVAAFGFGAIVSTLAAKRLSRRSPQPLPYAQRWMLEPTRPFMPTRNLRRALAPRAGERILEIGPGTGRHAVNIAERLAPDGVLDALDVQPTMLDAVLVRARRRDVNDIRITVGDARELPWASATFDAAYLVTVLGEIPDRILLSPSSVAC